MDETPPNVNTFELKDAKYPPDVLFDYTPSLRRGKTPIVIDNGSCQARVGWATDKDPRLVFRTLIARARREKGKKEVVSDAQVGNEIANIETVRFLLKTPFDRNLVTQFEAMEQIYDYIFSRLGIDTEGKVDHPIVLTEPFLNFNYSRQLMSELLFESYNVPGICYGVDGLFSYRLVHGEKSGIVLSLGYHTTHVIPILKGNPVLEHSRRINIGGFHIVGFLHRLLQLKYPAHANSITLSRAEEILHDHTDVAEDFFSDLKKWSTPEYYDKNVHIIQLAYYTPVHSATLTVEQQKEKKRELQRRLYEVNARKRDEKLNLEQKQMNKLLEAREYLETGQMKFLLKSINALGLPDVASLSRAITASEQKLAAIREKIHAASLAAESVDEVKPLVVQQPPDKAEQEALVARLREKREELLSRRTARRQRKRDLAQRRTVAAQERMRLISQLARKDKKEDNFGMRDEDWDVYKTINKDCGSSDSEEEMEKLTALETELKANDPAFETGTGDNMAPGESHQLHVATERIRAPEVLFQPSLVGSHEAGLTETLEFVLKRFSAEDQLELASNIYVTGGCASFTGIIPRLHRELMEMRPFQSKFHVAVAKDPLLSAWRGARAFAVSSDFKNSLFTRNDYDEKGGDYFKTNSVSNQYHPTPKALSVVKEAF